MEKTAVVRIEKMAAGGQSIAKEKGSDRVIFVPYGAPGDVLEISITQERPRYAFGSILRIIQPGPGRTEPLCPHYFNPGKGGQATFSCGGCDWQHLEISCQRRIKREILIDCLTRIGKIRSPNVLPAAASPQPWRYRNKIQVPFRGEGVRRTGEGMAVKAGFYAPGSHEIVEFEDCLLQPELASRITGFVKEWVAIHELPAYDEKRNLGWLRHLYVRTNTEGKALVCFVTRTPDFLALDKTITALRAKFPEIVSIYQNIQPLKSSVILGPRWKKLWGARTLRENVGPIALEISPGSFLQVNTPAAEILYSETGKLIFEDGFFPGIVLDLYSGAGAIGIWIARALASASHGKANSGSSQAARGARGTWGIGDADPSSLHLGRQRRCSGRVIGVEENPQAVHDAHFNARLNGVTNIVFARGKVETALHRIRGLEEHPKPWAAVLDSPRSGCQLQVLKFLKRRPFKRVVYVSCNPATLARDAFLLEKSGYALRKVQPVDLFPQTSHIEAIAQFTRR